MACGRCGGFMIVEPTSACLKDSAQSESQCTRCLNCGNVEDSVICLNRTGRIVAHGTIARLRGCIRV